MKNLIRKVLRIRLNRTHQKHSSNSLQKSKFSNKPSSVSFNANKILILSSLGLFSSYLFLKNKVECLEKGPASQQGDVQIFELNKNQFVELLSNVNQESVVIVYNKYFRNQHEQQFARKLQNLYNMAQKLRISKILLIEKTQIRHLQIFQRWLHNQTSQKTGQQTSEKENLQYYYLTPEFKDNPFKLQEEQISEQIKQIRSYQIKKNPLNIQQQIFSNFNTKFNLTTVVKQCPQYVTSDKQNECIEEYRKKIATMIEQKMLKNKSDQYKFYAISPNSKKDLTPLISFHNQLKKYHTQQNISKESLEDQFYYSKTVQNVYVLRNDMLGKQIERIKDFKKKNYSSLKNLSSYEKFLLFIKPRIFIISKANSSIDLYWYVTCMHKNKQSTISVNNVDNFFLGKKYDGANGFQFQFNNDLQLLKVLYKNHPELNYIVVNTDIVTELIRHISMRKKYTIFSLNKDLIYPKMFLPEYDSALTPQQNYQKNFRPLILKYLVQPKLYDRIVLDQQKKINPKQLQELMKKTSNPKFLLRVCKQQCQQDLSNQKVQKAYAALLEKTNQNQKVTQNQAAAEQSDQNKINRKQKIFTQTYWIDSHYNNTGLNQGDYIFSDNKFQEL